jgi:hypothetical protein
VRFACACFILIKAHDDDARILHFQKRVIFQYLLIQSRDAGLPAAAAAASRATAACSLACASSYTPGPAAARTACIQWRTTGCGASNCSSCGWLGSATIILHWQHITGTRFTPVRVKSCCANMTQERMCAGKQASAPAAADVDEPPSSSIGSGTRQGAVQIRKPGELGRSHDYNCFN